MTTTSDKYATSFGFTEEEVFAVLEECGRAAEKEQIKRWYDGFIFGEHKDIYNPWSILNFLDKGVFTTYWANTSSNSLVGKLLREGNRRIKEKFETLLRGESIQSVIDEQIVYNQLDGNERAVWSLLLGDVKAVNAYMNRVSLEVFCYFDTGNRPSGEEPERFYHGFVLGLIVDLQGRYIIMGDADGSYDFGHLDSFVEKLREGNALVMGNRFCGGN